MEHMGKGYTRFSAAMRQTEGEDSDGVSHKLLKKVKKLSSVGKTDQSSSSKRVKLPKKFFDDCHTVNQAPIPKKLRSAITRHYDSISGLPNPKDGIRRLEKPLEDDSTKVEFNKDERQQSTISESISEQIPIDEEEAIASLLLLSANNDTNEINLKTETSNSEGLVKNDMVIEDLNKSTNTVDAKKDCNDFRDGKVSQKICSRHVYICQMIKQLQDMEGKTVISHKEEKTNKIKDSVTKESTTMTLFQDHWHGCGVEARDSSVAQNQVPVSPYFGSPLYDPSQWGKPPKHQMWMKPFMSGGCYQNLQKSGHDMMPHHSNPNNIQPPSLLNVLGSKENDGLFLVDSSPTLNLMCNEHLGRDRSWLSDL